MKRVIIAIVLVFLLVSPLFAGGAKEAGSSSDKITLSFLNKYPEAQYLAYFEGAVKDFEAQNPDIDIVLESVSDQAIKDKLSVMAAGGEMPDIFFSWSGEYLKKFARSGLIADLTPYLERDTAWADGFLSAYLNNSTFEGKTYGIPYRGSIMFMLYNKKIFADLGLQEPKTYAELLSVSEVLKNKGYIPIGFGNSQAWYSSWWIGTLNALLVSPENLNRDYNPNTTDFSNPAYVEALQYFIDLNEKGYFGKNVNSKDYYQVREEFMAGQSGMIMDATAQFSIYEDGSRDDWGYFRFPAVVGAAGDLGMNTGGAEVYAVSSTSEHKEAAVKFLKFMTTKEQAFKQTKESGLPNCIVGAITPENGSEKLIGALEIVNESITNVADWLDTAVESRVADQYMSSAQECLSGKSAQEAMSEVNAVAKTVRESMNQ